MTRAGVSTTSSGRQRGLRGFLTVAVSSLVLAPALVISAATAARADVIAPLSPSAWAEFLAAHPELKPAGGDLAKVGGRAATGLGGAGGALEAGAFYLGYKIGHDVLGPALFKWAFGPGGDVRSTIIPTAANSPVGWMLEDDWLDSVSGLPPTPLKTNEWLCGMGSNHTGQDCVSSYVLVNIAATPVDITYRQVCTDVTGGIVSDVATAMVGVNPGARMSYGGNPFSGSRCPTNAWIASRTWYAGVTTTPPVEGTVVQAESSTCANWRAYSNTGAIAEPNDVTCTFGVSTGNVVVSTHLGYPCQYRNGTSGSWTNISNGGVVALGGNSVVQFHTPDTTYPCVLDSFSVGGAPASYAAKTTGPVLYSWGYDITPNAPWTVKTNVQCRRTDGTVFMASSAEVTFTPTAGVAPPDLDFLSCPAIVPGSTPEVLTVTGGREADGPDTVIIAAPAPESDPRPDSGTEPDPDGSPQPSPGPSGAPGTGTPLEGENPADDPAGDPSAPEGSGRNCMGAAWSWNPVNWVFVPVKCALVWAFVPDEAVLQTKLETARDAFAASPPGQVGTMVEGVGTAVAALDDEAGGSCLGPELALTFDGHPTPVYPINACPGTIGEKVAAVVKPLSTLVLAVGAVMTVASVLAGSVGVKMPWQGGD